MTCVRTKRWVAAAVLFLLTLAMLGFASRAEAKVVASEDGLYSVDPGADPSGGATVRMVTGPSHEVSPPDAANAERIGEQVAELLSSGLPQGVRVVASSSKIAWGKNVPVVRTTVKVEGSLPPGPNADVTAREVLTAVGPRTLYITVWSGTDAQAGELAKAADEAAKTTDLKPEGRPFKALNPWPGRLLFFFGVAGLILLRVRMKKNAAMKKKKSG